MNARRQSTPRISITSSSTQKQDLIAKTWKRWLAVALIVFPLFMVGSVELTSQSWFCNSCHIMKPYYEAWKHSKHGKVACVECHYAPGERTTINAKLRGLSQVASYFSGRYGATRPRAHVSNDSCMTAKCHGDLRFMDKTIEIGSVRFVHAKHLRLDKEALQATQNELETLRKALRAAMADKFDALQSAANEAVPHDARLEKLMNLAAVSGADIARSDLEKFSQLTHFSVRTAQLAEIQCTNCHSYAEQRDGQREAPTHHFAVNTTSCYTCHFNNEGFNTGTNSCLMCHKELPAGEIIVHKELSAAEGQKLQSPDLTAKAVKMNHQAILERKVDCASCHAEDGKRIRMQDLPVLSEKDGAQRAYTTWPAYRVSNSQLKTMQWRIWDCYRQMRFPEPQFVSEATIALTHFLAVTANGAPYAGPGTKR